MIQIGNPPWKPSNYENRSNDDTNNFFWIALTSNIVLLNLYHYFGMSGENIVRVTYYVIAKFEILIALNKIQKYLFTKIVFKSIPNRLEKSIFDVFQRLLCFE